jgi:mannose-1-phosphate guanylyltransferase
MKIHAVIMAGGSGTRLWPLSRENFPKQFVKIFDGKSLLQLCLERNKNFEKITLIVGIEHRFIALEQAHEVGLDPEIIIEPFAKNTAPCAILAGLIGKKSGSDIMLLLPADHYIDNIEDYIGTVKEAAKLAITHSVATIGIKPNTPHTGYGYIELGNHVNEESFEVPHPDGTMKVNFPKNIDTSKPLRVKGKGFKYNGVGDLFINQYLKYEKL